MADSQLNVSLSELRKQITSWLRSRLDKEGLNWITEKSDTMLKDGEDWEFFTSFSAVPRYTGKQQLDLSEEEQQRAEEIRSGWKPQYWSVDELGRTLMILSIANRDQQDFLETLEKTHQSSDMGEAEALYKALPVLPYPDRLQDRAAEGIRSNMTSVFSAVALHNPYPADYFDEGAWNQMVLKALFVGVPLYKIQGLEERRNKKLAEMLVDYAHERWAADRSVSPELWRPVGPYADDTIATEDLQKVLGHPDELHRLAAVLALSESPADAAQKLVAEHSGLKNKIDEQHITWDDIGQGFEEQG